MTDEATKWVRTTGWLAAQLGRDKTPRATEGEGAGERKKQPFPHLCASLVLVFVAPPHPPPLTSHDEDKHCDGEQMGATVI